MTVTGSLVGPPGMTLEPGSPVSVDVYRSRPGVAHGGGVHLVMYLVSGGLSWARFRASDGHPLDAVARRAHTSSDACYGATTPAVAFANDTFLAVWSANNRICSWRIRPDGTVLDPRPVTLIEVPEFTNWFAEPAVATNGTDFFVTWQQRSASNPAELDLYGARVRGSDGTSMDGTGRALVTTPGTQERTAVAFDGVNYFMIWRDLVDSGSIRGLRVKPADGMPVESAPFRVTMPSCIRPQIARGASTLLVVYHEGPRVRAVRVRAADAQVLDPDTFIISNPAQVLYNSDAVNPSVVWDGQHFTVAFRVAERGPSGLIWQVRSVRVAESGQVVGNPVSYETEIGEYGSQFVSAGPDANLVGWTREGPPSWGSSSWWGVLADPASGAAKGAPFPLSRTAAPQGLPVTSFDGRQHLVAFEEWNGSTYKVRAARVRDHDGARLDPGGFALLDPLVPLGAQIEPRSASNGRNHLVVWTEGTELRATRVNGDDGTMLDRPGVRWTAGAFFDSINRDYAVASNGSDYLVIWVDGLPGAQPVRLLARRISGSDGTILDASPRELRAAPRILSLRISSGGGRFLVSWFEPAAKQIVSLVLAPDATPAGPVVVLADDVRDVQPFIQLNATSNDTGFVIWSNALEMNGLLHGGFFGQRVRLADGVALGDRISLVDRSMETFAIARSLVFDGEHFVLLGSTRRGARSSDDLALIRIALDGSVLDRPSLRLTDDPDWNEHAGGLSPGIGGRLLAAYLGHDARPEVGARRVHMRMLGVPPPAPDAGAPSDGSAADVPPAGVDAPPDSTADATPELPPAASDAMAADAPAVDAAGPADAGAPDGTPPGDVAPETSSPDVAAETAPPADGAPVGDVATEAGARADAADARDARADGGGDSPDPACACRLGGPGHARSSALNLLAAVAFAGLLGRRRRSTSRS